MIHHHYISSSLKTLQEGITTSHGLHARAPKGKIKYEVANANQFHLCVWRAAQNNSQRHKCTVSSGLQIALFLSLSLSLALASNSVPCTLQLQKESSCHVRSKQHFLVHSVHLFIPHCVTSDHTEFTGSYTHLQCASAGIQAEDICMCICTCTDNQI